MADVVLIAAVARNGVIGNGGALPWRLPRDMVHFRELTRGHPIVMGRRTWESIGRALPDRRNLVLSTTLSARFIGGIEVATSVEDVLARVGSERLYVIGGSEVYASFLPFATRIELTRVWAEFRGDAFFPEFDRAGWRVVREEVHQIDSEHSAAFAFETLERAA